MTFFKPNIGTNLLCLSKLMREPFSRAKQLNTWSYIRHFDGIHRHQINTHTANRTHHASHRRPNCQLSMVRQINTSQRLCDDKEDETLDMSAFGDREFEDIKVEDFETLYLSDETGETKTTIETILNEYEFMKYNTSGRVPSSISNDEMTKILTEGSSPRNRERLFNFLFKREMMKLAQERRKKESQRLTREKLASRNEERAAQYGEHGRAGLVCSEGKLLYGLWHNSLFTRITEKKYKIKASTNNLIRASNEKRTLVFDFDYDDYMSSWASRSLSEQVQAAYGINRFQYEECYDFWFCNFNKETEVGKFMKRKALPNLYNGSMITVKEDDYTNHFDPRDCIYLSPHSPIRLRRLDPNVTYIVGAFNDKGSSRPLSYKKAISKGVMCKSLPLDDHIAWQGSTKSLCLNHVVGILLEYLHNGGDWEAAMVKHIPSRKIKPRELVLEEEERRKAKMFKQHWFNKKNAFSIRADPDL